MIETIHITKVTASEVALLENISKRSFIESYSDKNTAKNMDQYMAENFNANQLVTQLKNPDSEFYFSVINDQVVGYLKINFGKAQTEQNHPNSVEIERIYVLKEFQGKKIGQLLCNKAYQVGRQNKAAYLWLGVWEGNHKALGFYKKYGFVEFDKHTFKLGEDLQMDILMKLEL